MFGASAGMDSYYVAIGALTLLAGTAQNTLESAVLPILAMAEKEGRDRDFMASVFRIAVAITLFVVVVLGLFSLPYVSLFALHFDQERLIIASRMLLLLLPWGIATVLNGFMISWSTHKGRYTLSSVATSPFNLVMLPLMVLLATRWGSYSLAVAQSVALVLCSILFWRLLRGFPLRYRSVPRDLLGKAGRDSLLCLGLAGASSLYLATDRFFASSLPVGNVSAISYASVVFGLPLGFAVAPLLMYLSKSSKAVAQRGEARGQLKGALSIGWAYFMICGMAMMAVSKPLVTLVFNYGAFDSYATDLTSACLSALAIALPFALWQTVLFRYIQSIGRLSLVVSWSYVSILINALLDWFFASRFGAPGICFATSLVWLISSFVYMTRLTPGLFREIAAPIACQLFVAALWVVPLKLFLSGTIIPLTVALFSVILHVLICEKLGFYRDLPESWRPVFILKLVVGKVFRS
nr:lipid II flippase MurJ [Dethiosulfovibrio faecalis]